jgi:hypothetical protein
MEIRGKVHCFFEQSGTFKNEFIRLGIPAEDYDLKDNFGQTDNVVDLFDAIEDAYEGKPSLFDNITPDDLIFAFFPCIKFCNVAEFNQSSKADVMRRHGASVEKVYAYLKKESDERYFFYQKCLKMHAVVEMRGLRMIMENPWGELNYTNHFWFKKVTLIDRDRTKRGDYFVKPTGYWYTNCEPTMLETYQPVAPEKRKWVSAGSWTDDVHKFTSEQVAKPSRKMGECSEERSLISPDYARNFICDFVLGIRQDGITKGKLF